ncbi:DUF2140 family protein [Salsuginibacillus kocurii]|uniref:DUF2140 family protein n=1 Tax=Salsuginibacillus kocurii TaxID=427078 RepID=UPI00037163E9|nr:DUF2140 family protein [Salsuginibacillus kocurii]
MRQRRNGWKWAFLFLLSLNLLILILGWVAVQSLIPETSDTSTSQLEESDNGGEVEEQGQSVAQIETNFSQLNQLINAQDTGGFEVVFDQQGVTLSNTYTVLGQEAGLDMRFIPEATEQGDIRLTKESFSFGPINLPGPQVLEIVQSQGDVPEWLHIDPANEMLQIEMAEMDISEDYYMLAESIDLEHETAQLTLYQR